MGKNRQLITLLAISTTYIFINCQSNSPYLLIEDSKIRSDVQTVNVNEDSNLGFCGCDTTSNYCNNYCCCDPDCPQSVVDLWKSLKIPQCIYTFSANMYCLASNLVYTINRRRGMKLITDPDLTDGEICVEVDKLVSTADNVKEISSLSQADASRIAISKSSSQNELRNNNPVTTPKEIYYKFGMPIVAKHESLTELSTIYYPTPDMYGFCKHLLPIRYQVDVPMQKCTRRTILREVCQLDHTSLLAVNRYSDQFKVFSTPNLTNPDIIEKINQMYLIDPLTGTTTKWVPKGSIYPWLEEINQTHCNCHNVLKGVNYYISEWNASILDVKVDLYLSESNIDLCDEEVLIDQTFLIKFGNFMKYTGAYSGYPGYITGSPLLIGYIGTSLYSTARVVYLDKKGFYLRGVSKTGKCKTVEDPTNQYNPLLDDIMRFPENILRSCAIDLNKAGLQNLCSINEFQKIEMFKIFNESLYIGQYGNADYHLLGDWVGINFENPLNESDFKWDDTNSTCTMPDRELVTIYYKTSGLVSRKQFYVAKLIKTYKKGSLLTFKTNGGTIQSFNFFSDIRFVNIDNDDINTSPDPPPGFFPEIPKDFFKPIWFDWAPHSEVLTPTIWLCAIILLMYIF